MIYFICIFLFIIIYYLVFNTPFFLINNLFGFSQMKSFILNYYIFKNNEVYSKTFEIDHKKYDGRLTSMLLKKKNIRLNNLNKINNNSIKIYEKHNILSNLLDFKKNDTLFSSLNYNVSHLLKFMCNTQKRNLNVCIVVSTRDETNYTNGNLIKLGFFNVHKSMDNIEIMKRFKNCVEKCKKDSKKFLNIYDILRFLNCNITINSWKDLSEMQTSYGLILKRFETSLFSKTELLNNLLDGKKGKVVFFDKYNNDWIINKIENISIFDCNFF